MKSIKDGEEAMDVSCDRNWEAKIYVCCCCNRHDCSYCSFIAKTTRQHSFMVKNNKTGGASITTVTVNKKPTLLPKHKADCLAYFMDHVKLSTRKFVDAFTEVHVDEKCFFVDGDTVRKKFYRCKKRCRQAHLETFLLVWPSHWSVLGNNRSFHPRSLLNSFFVRSLFARHF